MSNILDSFFFLFKTNAKDAQRDVEAFDKSTKKTQDDLNAADSSASKLGLSFSKLALSGVAALETVHALGKLKDGIINQINFNAQLEKTSKLTNINSRELAIWNGVVSQAGGNPNSKEYLSYITKLNQQYAGLGINQRIKNVNRDLGETADKIRDLNAASPGAGYAFAQKLGIGDDLYLALKNGKAGLAALTAEQEKYNNTTEETTRLSFELEQQWGNIGTQFKSAFNSAIPFAEVFVALMGKLAKFTRVFIDLFTLSGWKDLVKMGEQDFPQLFGTGGKFQVEGGGATAPGAKPGSNQNESRAFWKSLGYTDAQIAALLANEQAEGGFSSNAVGDNGQAKGIFQWHAARRRKILAATGIDVANASHADQLKAAAWELDQTGTSDRLRGAQTPGQGASILTGYEAPANAGYQSYIRGQNADSIFAQMMASGQGAVAGADGVNIPAGSGNTKSMTIGAITINTQATDADGMAKDTHAALEQHFATTVGSFDDGVKY